MQLSSHKQLSHGQRATQPQLIHVSTIAKERGNDQHHWSPSDRELQVDRINTHQW